MELAAARHKGFVGQYSSETNGTYSKKRLLVVIGIATGFERKKHRDAVRKSWLPTGAAMKKLELEKGQIVEIVQIERLTMKIGRQRISSYLIIMRKLLTSSQKRQNCFLFTQQKHGMPSSMLKLMMMSMFT